MQARRCTIDTSCLIALDHLDLIPQLSLLFSNVLVPKAVREELFKQRITKDRIQAIFDRYAFFERCDGYETGTVEFLRAERTRQGSEDRGEVEVVVQAAQFGAVVIVDDRWGTKLATANDLETHGTFWVLRRFHELQLLSSNALRACFISLDKRGMRLPREIVNALLVDIGEEPL